MDEHQNEPAYFQQLNEQIKQQAEQNKLLSERLNALEEQLGSLDRQLKAVAEIHLSAIEENTAQIGLVIELLKPFSWRQILKSFRL
jgi:DNA repair exonuclease SbcCD ATPase subunit